LRKLRQKQPVWKSQDNVGFGMSVAEKMELEKVKGEELERRMKITFFTYEMVWLTIVSIMCIWVMVGDYSIFLKAPCTTLLILITKKVLGHLTNKV
jgi:hypothetical protein